MPSAVPIKPIASKALFAAVKAMLERSEGLSDWN